MLTTSESLLVHSIEGFLSPDDVAAVLTSMSAVIDRRGRVSFDDQRQTSVHAVKGMTTDEAAKMYEPAGRVEIADLPPDVLDLLDKAAARALPHLTRLFPSGARLTSWIYLEYGPEQYIIPHIDMPFDDADSSMYKVAGIGVPLNDGYEGGEFFVQTCGSEALWEPRDEQLALVREGADSSSDWYPALPKTRWAVRPAPGTAVMYGSQVSHGTLPVTSGRIKKIIGFFTS